MHVHESKKPCYGGSVFEVDELLIFLHNYPYCLLLLFVIRKEQHIWTDLVVWMQTTIRMWRCVINVISLLNTHETTWPLH